MFEASLIPIRKHVGEVIALLLGYSAAGCYPRLVA